MDPVKQVLTARRYVAELQAKYGLALVEELAVRYHPAAVDENEWKTDVLAWKLWQNLERRAMQNAG